MMKQVCTVILCLILSGCFSTSNKRPSFFAWHGYQAKEEQQHFEYRLPRAGQWMDSKQVRTLEGKQRVPERVRMIRGERVNDYSERLREIYLKEKMDPVDFLEMVKASDELRCLYVDLHIIKRSQHGFIYRENAKECRKFPNHFVAFGQIVSTKKGLSHLQYQAIPERLSKERLAYMQKVVEYAQVR